MSLKTREHVRFELARGLEDESALHRYQLAEANRLLALARRAPFYAEKFKQFPVQFSSLEEWRTLPTTNKREVVADISAHPPFGSRAPQVDRRRLAHVVTTSGTTGLGQEVYPISIDDESAIFQMEARGFAWAGVGPESMVLNTLPMTTAAAGQWYYHGLRLLGATVLQVGPLPTDRKVQHLLQFSPDVLIGTPSYLFHLGVRTTELGHDPRALGVRVIVVAGESWDVHWIARLAETWGAPVFEQYGSTQRSMAWTCPRGAVVDGGRGVLHALEDFGLYEIVNPESGEPVAEGQAGELVITPFCSTAAPLVRFATGDRVTVAPPCPCGRPGLGFVSGLVSRYDYMIKVKGQNLWPDALDEAVFSCGVVEFEAQVELDDRGREILMISVEGHDPALRDLVAKAVQTRTGLTPRVVNVPPGAVTNGIADNFTKRTRLKDRRGGRPT